MDSTQTEHKKGFSSSYWDIGGAAPGFEKTVLSFFPMVSTMKLMPRPLELAWELTKPFVFVVGGFALFLAAMYLVIGQDPSIPVGRFLTGSVETLGPFMGLLFVLWLYYLIIYLVAGVYVHDLWIVARLPDNLADFLRRHCFSSQPDSTLPAHLIPSFSPGRLYRPHPPGLQVMGWRAGDSAQLE